MTRGPFERDGEAVIAKLAEVESGLLHHLARDLVALLAGVPVAPNPLQDNYPDEHAMAQVRQDEARRDPVVARLLPDAYANDPEAEDEFRYLTQSQLVDSKLRVQRLIMRTFGVSSGDPVRLELDQAGELLRGLTDLRLALAERLGIGEGEDATPSESDSVYAIYEWLTYLQVNLVDTLDS